MAERKTTKKQSEPESRTTADESESGAQAQSGTQSGTQSGSRAEAGEQTSEPTKPTGVSGPGTGAASPADEQARMPEGTVLATDAGPLVPSDVQKTREPAQGHLDSSTDAVGANAAQRSVPGTSHVQVVDEDDNEIAIDDLFTTKDPADPSVYVQTKRRVYQVFNYPGTRTQTRQLLYPAGARVTVFEAERVKAALREGTQDSAESMRPVPQGQRRADQQADQQTNQQSGQD